MKKIPKFLVLMAVVCCLFGCEKDWLTAKRELNTVLPTTLDDLTAILHADLILSLSNDYAGAQLVRDDDHYTTQEELFSYSEVERKLYTWDESVYDAVSRVTEWNSTYEQVFYTNVVLEQLDKITRTKNNAEQWDNVRGGALFFRAKAHYNVARQFAPPYVLGTGESLGEGIPLRLSSDPNVPSVRASLSETYDRIIRDLQAAVPLLPVEVGSKITPSKAAAYGLLARISLSIGDYYSAGFYADSCLQLHSELLDYKDFKVNSDADYPFPLMNEEVIFQSYLMPQYGTTTISGGTVDSILLASYEVKDTRRTLFFTTNGGFRGNYTTSNFKFSGIAVDEVLLIRAECLARAGENQKALHDLNRFLDHRIFEFKPYEGIAGDVLLELILEERRKQLLYRGLRWDELRRLNMEQARETVLYRNLNGVLHTLRPNDPKYALPIPEYIVNGSNIKQNEW